MAQVFKLIFGRKSIFFWKFEIWKWPYFLRVQKWLDFLKIKIYKNSLFWLIRLKDDPAPQTRPPNSSLGFILRFWSVTDRFLRADYKLVRGEKPAASCINEKLIFNAKDRRKIFWFLYNHVLAVEGRSTSTF